VFVCCEDSRMIVCGEATRSSADCFAIGSTERGGELRDEMKVRNIKVLR